MCRKKPYPRCAYHARLKWEKAEKSQDPQAIRKARDDYFLTPTGIKELKNKSMFKEAERFEARRNALIRRIKESLGEQDKTASKAKPSSAGSKAAPATANTTSKNTETSLYVSTLNPWEVIEERARLNVGFYAGSKYDVSAASRRDSTNADIHVTDRKSGKSGYIEVKKIPSRAGIQAVLSVKSDGTYVPSDSKQSKWVQPICDIVNKRSSGQDIVLSPDEQKQINAIMVNHYKSKNIMALMYTDAKGRDFSMCKVDDIPENIDIVLDVPRAKESGSSPWPKRDRSFIPGIIEGAGFASSDYTIEEQGRRTYVKFKKSPALASKMEKNQSGYSTAETAQGFLPQFSNVEGTDLVYEIRKRSKTANPTAIIRMKKNKAPITRYPSRILKEVLAQLSD